MAANCACRLWGKSLRRSQSLVVTLFSSQMTDLLGSPNSSSIPGALPHNSPPALFIFQLLNSNIHLSTIGHDAILYFYLHVLARGPAQNQTLQQAIVANSTNLCLLGRNQKLLQCMLSTICNTNLPIVSYNYDTLKRFKSRAEMWYFSSYKTKISWSHIF